MIKITTLMIALALFVSATAFANEKGCYMGGKEGFAEKRVERLTEKLSLSDAQAAQIKSIFDSKKEKMIALKNETNDQVAAVLTPEQKEKFEAMKKEFKEKRKGHKGNYKEAGEKRA